MKYDFITIGGATEDITFYTHEGKLIANRNDILRQKLMAFEYGSKIRVDKSHSTFGGGATNVAVSLSRLGFKVASIIAVGNDIRGVGIVNNLIKHKVNTSLVRKIRDVETGFSLLLVGEDNEHIVFSNRAANSELEITRKDLVALRNTKWIYITSLSDNWQNILKKVVSIKKLKIVWNPGQTQLQDGKSKISKYLKSIHVLSVNKDEAIELVVSDKLYRNKPFKFLNRIENLIKIIKSWGPEIVVITDGKNGAYVYDGNKIYKQPIVKESKRVDTTGVGDSFGSSFAAGLELFDGNIKKAMLLGAKNSASVVSKQGAQNGLLTKKDIKNIIK